MNTKPDARAGLTIVQETIQTVLLIIVSFVGTWLGLYRVPWQVSGDPCLLAAAATVVIVTCLWLTRWRGLRGVIFERNLLAGFLVGMPLVYVARYMFASTGRAGNYWFLGRASRHNHFCRSFRARCEALALVPCHRNGTPRIGLGYLALPELDIHPRLVRNCLPGGGPRLRSVCGGACSRISESIAH
jgi:hypothetical protein